MRRRLCNLRLPTTIYVAVQKERSGALAREGICHGPWIVFCDWRFSWHVRQRGCRIAGRRGEPQAAPQRPEETRHRPGRFRQARPLLGRPRKKRTIAEFELKPRGAEFVGGRGFFERQPSPLLLGFYERRSDCSNRTEQDKRIVLRRQKSPSLPELRRLPVDCIDHERTSSNQICSLNAALERVLQQASADTAPSPFCIGRKLAKEKTGHRIGRLPCANRPGQDRRHHSRRRQGIISDHSAGLVDNENGREAFLLIGERARFQPVIKCRFPAGKPGNVVSCAKRFGSR